ncbi:unnamed protein product [Somion occarium]|uniref:Uncharacterized protein n=1 Tax=Somion occarium TaxID=3059160 RepID=A0ABP1DDI6_9APHY
MESHQSTSETNIPCVPSVLNRSFSLHNFAYVYLFTLLPRDELNILSFNDHTLRYNSSYVHHLSRRSWCFYLAIAVNCRLLVLFRCHSILLAPDKRPLPTCAVWLLADADDFQPIGCKLVPFFSLVTHWRSRKLLCMVTTSMRLLALMTTTTTVMKTSMRTWSEAIEIDDEEEFMGI